MSEPELPLGKRHYRDVNRYWIIGSIAIVDVSTKTYPRATMMINLIDLQFIVDGLGHWYAKRPRSKNRTIYACRTIKRKEKSFHRNLCGIEGYEVDHKNHDGLDNRRQNLRPATRSQNNMNIKSKEGASKYKGVYWHAQRRKWAAMIATNRKKKYLGIFISEEEAAKAYNDAAILYFGEFAWLNILP